jgi:hypothetical protein
VTCTYKSDIDMNNFGQCRTSIPFNSTSNLCFIPGSLGSPCREVFRQPTSPYKFSTNWCWRSAKKGSLRELRVVHGGFFSLFFEACIVFDIRKRLSLKNTCRSFIQRELVEG